MNREFFVDGELHVEFRTTQKQNPRVIIDGVMDIPLELFWNLLNDKEIKLETEKRYASFALFDATSHKI